MLPRLRRYPIATEVLKILGLDLVWQDRQQRLPLPCPVCKAAELSRNGSFPMIFLGGGIYSESDERCSPHRITCEACGRGPDVTDLLSNLSAKQLDDLVLRGPFRQFMPPAQIFIAADVGGRLNVGRTTPEALDPLLGAKFEMAQRLCRVEALTLEQATELVLEHHKDMPWKLVEIDRDREPRDPGWHGGPLSATEKQRVDSLRQMAKARARADLELELDQIRAAREAGLH
jgi:hypothetical protein